MEFNKTSKEQVRVYLRQRQVERRPLPDMDEIRRKVGWSPLQPLAKQR